MIDLGGGVRSVKNYYKVLSLDDWVNVDDFVWYDEYREKIRVLGNDSRFSVRYVVFKMFII